MALIASLAGVPVKRDTTTWYADPRL